MAAPRGPEDPNPWVPHPHLCSPQPQPSSREPSSSDTDPGERGADHDGACPRCTRQHPPPAAPSPGAAQRDQDCERRWDRDWDRDRVAVWGWEREQDGGKGLRWGRGGPRRRRGPWQDDSNRVRLIAEAFEQQVQREATWAAREKQVQHHGDAGAPASPPHGPRSRPQHPRKGRSPDKDPAPHRGRLRPQGSPGPPRVPRVQGWGGRVSTWL